MASLGGRESVEGGGLESGRRKRSERKSFFFQFQVFFSSLSTSLLPSRRKESIQFVIPVFPFPIKQAPTAGEKERHRDSALSTETEFQVERGRKTQNSKNSKKIHNFVSKNERKKETSQKKDYVNLQKLSRVAIFDFYLFFDKNLPNYR